MIQFISMFYFHTKLMVNTNLEYFKHVDCAMKKDTRDQDTQAYDKTTIIYH